MKKLAALISTICLCLSSYAQEANNWYFGAHAGITFNTSPPSILTDGAINTDEGTAAVSDGLGNLLFYTDGRTVWNKNHQPMPNGFGLLGERSSTHAAVVVRKPGSTHLYYIFTADENHETPNGNGGGLKGYCYSILDMTLNNGLGDITATKNVLLYTPSTEKLAVALHADGTSIWVITKEKDNDVFRTYLLTCNGLSTNPIVSTVAALSTDYTGYRYGQLKVSPDGQLMANARNNEGKWDLFRFDNATGIISDRILFDLGVNNGVASYGVEFSPDSKLLYINGGYTYQYKVDVYDHITIDRSRYQVSVLGPHFHTALQTGPDMKIYSCSNRSPSSHLSVIHQPNVYGPGCTYEANAIDVGGANIRFGLPGYLPSVVQPVHTADYNYTINAGCESVSFTATTTNLPGPVTYEWDFGDGQTGTGQTVTHSFPVTSNDFVVTLIIRNPNCGLVTKMKRLVFDRVVPVADFPAGSFCGTQTVNFQSQSTIQPPGSIISYTWDFGDGNTSALPNPAHTYANYGEYNVKLTVLSSDGCGSTSSETNIVRVGASPAVNFSVPDTCSNVSSPFTNQSTIANGTISNWWWDFGDGNTSVAQHPSHTYTTPGVYTVNLLATSDLNCISQWSQTIRSVARPQPGFDLPSLCLLDGAATFINTTTIADASPLSYTWYFDDPNATAANPNSSTLISPSHLYSAAANYMVKLLAATPGCRDSITQQFTVNGAVPRAKFTLGNQASVCSDEEIIIKDSSHVNFGRITRIEVDWGDGNAITDNNPAQLPARRSYTHNYPVFTSPASQDYTITMRAYSGIICVDTYTQMITLHATPVVQFDAIAPVCFKEMPANISTAFETGGLTGTGIYSGNGIVNGITGLFDPQLAGTGDHVIRYSFTTNHGCTDDAAQMITVKSNPAIFAGNDIIGVRGQPLQLEATGGNNYLWSPATGLSNLSIANPIATLSTGQLYAVLGTAANGCTGTDTIKITIFEKAYIYVPTGFTPNGDGLNDFIQPTYAGIKQLKYFRIYDRWGTLVFIGRNMSDRWDGTHKGHLGSTTNFVWVAEAVTFDGRTILQRGNIVLIR